MKHNIADWVRNNASKQAKTTATERSQPDAVNPPPDKKPFGGRFDGMHKEKTRADLNRVR